MQLITNATRLGQIEWTATPLGDYRARHGQARLDLTTIVEPCLTIRDPDGAARAKYRGGDVNKLRALIRSSRHGDVVSELVKSLRSADANGKDFEALVTEAHAELDNELDRMYPGLRPSSERT